MSEYKFYLFDNSDEEPKEICKKCFISEYSNAYFWGGKTSVCTGRLRKSSKYIEDEICRLLKKFNDKSGTPDPIDIVHIMAWKMGKLKHKDCSRGKGSFVYSKDWDGVEERIQENSGELSELILPFDNEPKGLEKPSAHKVLEIGRLAKYLCESFDSLKEKAKKSPIHFIEDLMKEHIKGIGFVYAVTLLYFFSGGEYPIYDKYARIALMKIVASKDSADFSGIASIVTDSEVEADIMAKGYMGSYVAYLNEIFKGEYKCCRNIDRALWVYGHMFNNTETNQNRMDRLKREEK